MDVSISGYTTPVARSRYAFEVFHVGTGDSIADFSLSRGDSYDEVDVEWDQSVSFIEGDDYRVFMEVAGSGWEMGPRHRLEVQGLPTDGSAAVVPTPAAAVGGGMLLAFLGFGRYVKRRRQQSAGA